MTNRDRQWAHWILTHAANVLTVVLVVGLILWATGVMR